MKQYITIDQLEELTQKQRVALRAYLLGDWKAEFKYKGEDYTTVLPNEHYLLSIGQIIEFLDKKSDFNQINHSYGWQIINYMYGERRIISSKPELCDALWEAVKEVLNK